MPSVQNKGLRNKILSVEAPKAKTTVSFRAPMISTAGGGGAMLPGSTVRNQTQREVRQTTDMLSSPRYRRERGTKDFVKKLYGKDRYASGVAVDPTAGVETLAHELGHAQGKTAGGLRGYISRSDPRNSGQGIRVYAPSTRGEVSTGKRVGFGQALKDTVSNIRNSGHIIAEETAASRGGLQMMKRHGATKEELARASENLGLAGRTYKLEGKRSVLSSLGRLVDIPTRRV